jgi:uncharacterized protein (TIGR00255 family)
LVFYLKRWTSQKNRSAEKSLRLLRSILAENDESKGKKLAFIMQEIGREINTTGSKAYDSEIQKSVVLMKDELEKAKEQVLNVL